MNKLTSKIDVSTADMYYDERFRLLIEQHLNALITFQGNVYLTVSPMEFEVWAGNLYGYLHSQNIPIEQHWIIMRMNNMDSTLDFSDVLVNLILPDMEQITKLREMFNTIYRI